jgi:esterase/lipase superfamily enzyme
MDTTVFFASNRVLTGPADEPGSYSGAMQPIGSGQGMVYGSAFVGGLDLASNNAGTITSIQETALGQFPPSATGDLGDGNRNLLIFIHGFDNDFSDAITRAAFNQQWLAASGLAGTDTTVVSFSWPSSGQIIGFPVLDSAYRADQTMAQNSAYHLMCFLENLEPILTAAQANHQRTFLLAHSMGNLALENAVAQWTQNGNGPAQLFDCVVLAAGDCSFDSFTKPGNAGLSGLATLTERISIYYSHADDVLKLSNFVNGVARLGQNGPLDGHDATQFPAAEFQIVDATGFKDYGFNLLTSHQYYRLSPSCRQVIAGDMAGMAGAGAGSTTAIAAATLPRAAE